MALKGLDIFKLSPKKNCKECGSPTCMAFSMKVAQGSVSIDKCPYMSEDARRLVDEANAPPMATIGFGAGDHTFKLGGETVLYRHDKTFVSKNLLGVCSCPEHFDEKLPELEKVDYERIGERMHTEVLYLKDKGDKDAYLELIRKAMATDRALILEPASLETAQAALELCASDKPILSGANTENYAQMVELAKKYDIPLGLHADGLDALFDLTAAVEALGWKKLVLDVTGKTVKETFANAVQLRRAALKNQVRTCGYPSLVNAARLAHGDAAMQTAIASVFTLKYGSIIIMEHLSYAQALPLFGLRQNIYTDPQKPMRVAPGVYPINGADENSVCVTTVDFALTYFIVSGELERSGVPCNLLISDAGGYSVLTSWAAGKFSAGSISAFIRENGIEEKFRSRTLVIPGKVAVLKGELEERLPDWSIVVAPNDATGLVKFMKQLS